MRQASLKRKTTETAIELDLNIDGSGRCQCQTGIGFFDHMIAQLARHALMDITLKAVGDLHIDDHHTVEDCAIVLGQAFVKALGDKAGIQRYGCFDLVMDDARISAALDLSGRPFFAWNVAFPTQKIGQFDTELVREFFQAFSFSGLVTLHLDKIRGENSHHIAEACFKAVARALRIAVAADLREGKSVPSTKGQL